MNKTTLTKSLAILLNLTLVGTSFADVGMAGAAAPAAMPDFVKALTPPEQLGYITDSFQGNTDKPVILIQDLHANYGVQKKILGLLKHFQTLIAGGRSMTVGVEAAWGDIDTSSLKAEHSPQVVSAASDFLMKNAEFSGMDDFALTSPTPVHLVGIDNPDDYLVQVNQYRASIEARLALARKVKVLRDAVIQSKGEAPLALRHLWKIADSFHAGKIDLEELAKKLDVPSIANYGDAEALLAQREMEVAREKQAGQGVFLTNTVKADQDLELLSRLLLEQLTLEEVQYAATRVPEMLVVIQTLIPNEPMEGWREAIKSAIDYYAIALVRDKPLSEHARELAEKNAGQSVVVVTGGFHTAGIENYFKEKKISYVTVAPVVESHTSRDEALYIKRMMGYHLTEQDVAQAAQVLKASGHSAAPIEALQTNPVADEISNGGRNYVEGTMEAVEGNTQHLEALTRRNPVPNWLLNLIGKGVDSSQAKTPNALVARASGLLSRFNLFRRLSPVDSKPGVSGAASAQGQDLTAEQHGAVKLALAQNAGVRVTPNISALEKANPALARAVRAVPLFVNDALPPTSIAYSAMDVESGITVDQMGIHFPPGMLDFIQSLPVDQQVEFYNHEVLGHWSGKFKDETAIRKAYPISNVQAALAARTTSASVSPTVSVNSVETALAEVPAITNGAGQVAQSRGLWGMARSGMAAVGSLLPFKQSAEAKAIAQRREQIIAEVRAAQA